MSEEKSMKSKMKTKPLYLCDPEKFKVYSGSGKEGWCGVECFCTTDKQFAKDPNHPLTYEEYVKERDRRQKKCAEENSRSNYGD